MTWVTGQLIGEESLADGMEGDLRRGRTNAVCDGGREREERFAALCRLFGVSRKAGYKWLARYQDAGVEGLFDRSRAPHYHPQAIADEIRRRSKTSP